MLEPADNLILRAVCSIYFVRCYKKIDLVTLRCVALAKPGGEMMYDF